MKEIHPHPPSKNVPAWGSNKKKFLNGRRAKKNSCELKIAHPPSLFYWSIPQLLARHESARGLDYQPQHFSSPWDDLRTTLS